MFAKTPPDSGHQNVASVKIPPTTYMSEVENEFYYRMLGLDLHIYYVNSNRINDMQLDKDRGCPMNRLSKDEWIFMLMNFSFLFLVLYLDL